MAPIPLDEKRGSYSPLKQDHDVEQLAEPAASSPSPKVSPKKLVAVVFAALLTVSLLHRPVLSCYHRVCNKGKLSIDQRVSKILTSTPLIDGHIDLAVSFRLDYGNQIDNDDFYETFKNGTYPRHVDLQRIRDGGLGGAFWSVYAPCPADGMDFSDENYAASVQFTLDQIDVTTRALDMFPDDFLGDIDSGSTTAAFKDGKIISPLGVEGLHQIGNSVSNLRRFHALGARYATLTHNCHNKYADAALQENPLRKAEPLWGGVSPLGRELVHEMNRIGMIVDLSHVSEDTMIDVLEGDDDWQGSIAPPIFSHSSAWSVCPHPRNPKDHVLQLVKKRNSVVMVNISPDFISCVEKDDNNGLPEFYPANATLHQVARHIMYIGDLIGYDHVGIGTDFDGIFAIPEGMEDVTKYPDLVAELLKYGVSDEDAGKVVGGNILRVWKEVDAVAAKMQAEGAPVMEDDRTVHMPEIEV